MALIAYVVVKTSIDGKIVSTEILKYLRLQAPSHLVPAHLVVVPQLVYTASGKVDGKGLISVMECYSTLGKTSMSVDGIVRIFGRILEVSDVNSESDFFEMGGDSLLATRVLSAIAREYETELSFADFFNARLLGHCRRASKACSGESHRRRRRVGWLTAAAELTRRGVQVIVLDARSRVGGRTHGIEVAPGSWADAGAAYLANVIRVFGR
jgi:acyl carrier protein